MKHRQSIYRQVQNVDWSIYRQVQIIEKKLHFIV